jgi:heat shock protein HslJ
MSRFEERIRGLDDVNVPDVWGMARVRDPQPPQEPPPRPIGKMATIVLASAIAVTSISFVVSTLGREEVQREGVSARSEPPTWVAEEARRIASANGDPDPTSAEWVLTDGRTAGTAVGLSDGDSSIRRYVVMLHGEFIAYMASTPPGFDAPTGSFMRLAIDPETHQVTDWSVSDREVDVPGLQPFTLPSPATTAPLVAGSTWQLTAIDGNPVPHLRRPITLIFSDDRVSGFDGCNWYGGKYQVRGGTIDADRIVSTLIRCEREIMNRSRAMLDRLVDASVGIEGTTLTLSTDAGTATFRRLDLNTPNDPTAALDCAPDDRVPVAPHAKVILQPAPPSYISANLSGIRRGELVRVSGSADPAGPSMWHVVRDAQVIGVIEVPTLDGTACRGSGIEGV